MEGWINVDLHNEHPNIYRDDMIKLNKIPQVKYEIIYAAHSVMYVPYNYDREMFSRWYQLLEKGGKVIIEEADNKEEWEGIKYLRETEYLMDRLRWVGFKEVKLRELPSWSRHSQGYCVEGIK